MSSMFDFGNYHSNQILQDYVSCLDAHLFLTGILKKAVLNINAEKVEMRICLTRNFNLKMLP